MIITQKIMFFDEVTDDITEAPPRKGLRRRYSESPSTKKINIIASVLHKNRIYSKQELISKLPEIRVLLKNKGVFGNSEPENFKLLAKALRAYSKAQDVSITLGEQEQILFEKMTTYALQDDFRRTPMSPDSKSFSSDSTFSPTTITPPFLDSRYSPDSEKYLIPSTPLDIPSSLIPPTPIENRSFHSIVESYDQLELAKSELAQRSQTLLNIIEKEDAPEVDHLIVGCGDTSIALWIEEHRERHSYPICSETLPAVLMVGKDSGSWRYDYTLAQRHAMLERRTAPYQAADFVTQETYDQNCHVNARHLYQANQCNLAETNAPVLNTTIEEIESNVVGKFDPETPWERPHCMYRARVATPSGIKHIYTKKLTFARDLVKQQIPCLCL